MQPILSPRRGQIFNSFSEDIDVDVVSLRAQANASMTASYIQNYITNIQYLVLTNTNFNFRFPEFRL